MKLLNLGYKESKNYIALVNCINDIKVPYRQRTNRPSHLKPTKSFKYKLIYKQNYRCYDCDKEFIKINYIDATVDHVIPYRYGSELSKFNCVIVCEPCNHKRDKSNILEVIEDHYGLIDYNMIKNIPIIKI
jgi:5-methylcytosine-specific restriction endonuclease McrA